MKANKITVTITVEVLSIDSVPGMLQEVVNQVDKEIECGMLFMGDGDQVEWNTERELVDF
jgi:hypothetical protein